MAGGALPFRSAVMLAAKEWGVPPWEVMRGPAHWFMRWIQETRIRNEAQDNTLVTYSSDDDGE